MAILTVLMATLNHIRQLLIRHKLKISCTKLLFFSIHLDWVHIAWQIRRFPPYIAWKHKSLVHSITSVMWLCKIFSFELWAIEYIDHSMHTVECGIFIECCRLFFILIPGSLALSRTKRQPMFMYVWRVLWHVISLEIRGIDEKGKTIKHKVFAFLCIEIWKYFPS